MAKKIDPQAKAKRQKIFAAVGGVILLGVLAFQVPRTLKLLHQSSASASPATPTATTSATASATGTVGGTATAATSAGSGDGLSDPNVLPAPRSGQLLAFSRFKSKDPFSQQIDVACGGDSGSTSDSGGGCGGSSTTQTSSGTSKTSGPAAGTPKTAPTGSAPAAKPTSAVISVDGASETVAVGAQFPASSPTFVLVSLTKSSAKISIAGGSLSGGSQTVTLKKGTPLTLENTTDGTRYVLRLVSVA